MILGILAATALPKFVDLTADATRAKVDALAGSFQTAVSLGNAVWGVKAAGTYMNDLPGYSDSTVDFNSSGFPVGTSFGPTSGPPAVSSSDCANLWNAILLSPPTVSTSASGTEWQAQGNVVTKKCIYTYLTVVTPARSITYDAGVGAVTKINP